MKKIVVGLAVLGLMAVCAVAGVRIDWQITYGAYNHLATDLSGNDNPLLANYSVVWQLIYAGDNDVADLPNLSNFANGWVGGDDAVWATRTIAQGGGTAVQDGTAWDQWLVRSGLTGDTVYRDYTWNTSGYVFQRIYEGSPTQLSWYFDGNEMPYGTGFDASNEHMTPDYLRSGTTSSGIQPDQQLPGAVPEPATMSLLGLGALVMAIRRRRS